MNEAFLAVLLCVLATAVNVAAQLVSHRLLQRYMRSIFIGFAAGLLFLAAAEFWRFGAYPNDFLSALVLLAGDFALYGCAGFLFFNFINVGESSIRIRILRELRAASGAMDETNLLRLYNDERIMATRLGRMVDNGQAQLVAGHYRLLSPTLVRMAATMRTLKWLLLRRHSEFE